MTDQSDQQQRSGQSVESWRLHVLIEAGYPLELAEKIAAKSNWEVDLHRAVELVACGCPPATAAEILL